VGEFITKKGVPRMYGTPYVIGKIKGFVIRRNSTVGEYVRIISEKIPIIYKK